MAACGARLPVQAAEPTVAGLVEKKDETTQVGGVVWCSVERNGVFEGAFAKLFARPRRPQSDADLRQVHGRPQKCAAVGMSFIRGMKAQTDCAMRRATSSSARRHGLPRHDDAESEARSHRAPISHPMFGWTRFGDACPTTPPRHSTARSSSIPAARAASARPSPPRRRQ